MNIYFGIVENRSDPLQLGRCQVRVVGLHTHDKNLLPTADLPWCATMQPTISAAMNGIGHTPIGPVEGTSVVVTYVDDSMQQGVILGALGGIATKPVPIDFDDSGPIIQEDVAGKQQVTLRTVVGPTNGNKLTFYDQNNRNKTDLTKELTANMQVSGYGITEGTTIVSIDSGLQVTISTEVRDYGENIITFDPPPPNFKAIAQSKTVTVASAVAVKADEVKQTPVNTSIPTIPPSYYKGKDTSKASEGIKALLAACDKVGLTTKVQKCALLAVAGGESGWKPIEEDYSYNPKGLVATFSFLNNPEDIEKYSYASKKMTKAEFFSVVYGPTRRGKGFFGHTTDAEGGMYFGRGFIQLTGKSNYQKYTKQAQALGLDIDLITDPSILISDINKSAIIAALYAKDRVPKGTNPNASPDYFYALMEAVGPAASKANKDLKKQFFDYFYGTLDTNDGVIKDAGPPATTSPVITNIPDGQPVPPGPSDASITSGSFGIGFRDPNNKYPLESHLNESDVNRLARGVIDGTIVKYKDTRRKLGIPKPFEGTWDQPRAPYGAQYPFNKVFESESGHVQEFDDTPGQERVNLYHRSGTYTEIDANGTQVNYIVGDNFILMENNGCIHVAGECNITVDGNLNINARSDANIQVAANAKIEVGNNAEIGIANDVTLAVGGDMETHVSGSYKLTADGGMEIVSGKALSVQSAEATSMKSSEHYLDSAGAVAIKAGGAFAAQASTTLGLKAGTDLFTTAGASNNIKAGGAVKLDGSQFLSQSGAAGSASSVEGVSSVEGSTLPAPSAGEPVFANPAYLPVPERRFEDEHPIETPDDWDSPEGRARKDKETKIGGIEEPPAVVVAEATSTVSGGSTTSTKVDCALIYTTKDFTNDYRLSRNFNLGMMIDGGVNGKHTLQSQMLKASKNSPERLYTVQEIVCNMAHTAQNVLEPLLEIFPGGIRGFRTQWTITSGYRLKGVVEHESPTSDHCKGHCVDLVFLGRGVSLSTPYDYSSKVETAIPYDQLILEYAWSRGNQVSWLHIGYKPENNRRMAFTMVNHNTYNPKGGTGYTPGFYLIDSVPPPKKG